MSVDQFKDALLSWLQCNPAIIPSLIGAAVALCVGGMTLYGVIKSLANSRMLSAADRQHTASEASKDRIATMRREVYMEAVTELVNAQYFLSTLPTQDLTKASTAMGLQGFQAAVSKVAVVAEQATAMKAREISTVYSKLVLESLVLLAQIAKARSATEHFAGQYEASNQAVLATLAEMDQINKTGAPDQKTFAAVKRSFDMHAAHAAQHAKNRDDAQAHVNAGTYEFGDSLLLKTETIALELDELACAIREELGVGADKAAFQQQTRETFAKMKVAYGDAMRQSVTDYQRDMQPPPPSPPKAE